PPPRLVSTRVQAPAPPWRRHRPASPFWSVQSSEASSCPCLPWYPPFATPVCRVAIVIDGAADSVRASGPARTATGFRFEEDHCLALPRLSRYLALQHKAVQVTALVHVVVGIRLMHDTPIVPQHPVAMPPLVAILVFFLGGVAHQIADQCQRFAVLHSRNRFYTHGVEKQRLAAILGMRANERMDPGRRHIPQARLADTAKGSGTVLAQI